MVPQCRWISDQTEFVIICFLLFPCVVSVHAQFMMSAFGSSCISDFVFANCERSVDVLHRFGKFGLQRYDKISLNMTPKARTLFQPLISVPECSTCLIAGMELECQLDTNSWLASFLLVCLCLTRLTTFCNKLIVKQVLWPRIERPMCDGRHFASSPLGESRPFFPLWCPLAVTTTESHLPLQT